MKTLQDRLAEMFPQPQQRGLKTEIAALCGVKPASVSNWFGNPEKVATISRQNAEKLIARYGLNVSAAWLAEGIGPKRDDHPTSGDGVGQSKVEEALDAWTVKASSRARGVIDQLKLLAQKNALGDEDWEMISQLALRFQAKAKKTK